MRLPGATLLIALGLLCLWLAVTGKLDKFAGAWNYIKTGDVQGATNAITGPITKPVANPLASVVDVPSYHMGNMLNTLVPGGSDNPGGML